jgi:hypothetical protein
MGYESLLPASHCQSWQSTLQRRTSKPAVWLCFWLSDWRMAIWSATPTLDARLVAAAVARPTRSLNAPAAETCQSKNALLVTLHADILLHTTLQHNAQSAAHPLHSLRFGPDNIAAALTAAICNLKRTAAQLNENSMQAAMHELLHNSPPAKPSTKALPALMCTVIYVRLCMLMAPLHSTAAGKMLELLLGSLPAP